MGKEKDVTMRSGAFECVSNLTPKFVSIGDKGEKYYKCLNCGNVYHRKPRDSKQGKKFCSHECYYKYINTHAKEQVKIEYKKTCDICGAAFITNRDKAKRCSPECQKEAARRNAKILSKAKHEGKQCTCKVCGKVFMPKYGDKKRSYCSTECNEKDLKQFSK